MEALHYLLKIKLIRLVVSWEPDAGHLIPVTKISKHVMWFYITAIYLQVTKAVN